jgi:predicted AAA+ superfamily ATPase
MARLTEFKPANAPASSETSGQDDVLRRIAAALERLAPAPPAAPALSGSDLFVWDAGHLRAATRTSRTEIGLLKGIDSQRDILLANTQRFARGLPANNALLWGAKGMGKSSLVKAVHTEVNANADEAVALVELHRDELTTLPALLATVAGSPRRWLVFCDDLSFDADESFRSLKAILEGGIEGRPDNVLFYATSNRRHMIPRQMIENEGVAPEARDPTHAAIRPGEAVDEKVSLSDRFGLWLGFHPASQDDYLAMVDGYAARYGLRAVDLHAQAIEWSQTRGARSGRVAWQFIQDLAGRLGAKLA